MKLWIWSDLHLEMQNIPLPPQAPDGVDAIVCAGDLCYAPDLAAGLSTSWIVTICL